MPKSKKEVIKEVLPPIIEDDEEKVTIDPEMIMGDAISDDEDGDDDEIPGEDDIDPFRDRFEE